VPRRLLAALLIFLALGCSLISDGISQGEAIRLAKQHAGPTAVLVSAEYGSSGPWMPSEPSGPAWIVRFTGNWPAGCPAVPPGAPQPNCPDAHHATIVLDYRTGAFITAEYTK
jgi:hypothetical protein